MISENIPMTGELRVVITDTNTGEVKQDKTFKNLVVSVGKNFIASRMAGTAQAVMTHMAIGTSQTSPAAGDTALGVESARVTVNVAGGTPTNNTVQYVAVFGPGVPASTTTLYEAGIFNAASAGTMLSRTTYSAITKGTSDSMTVTWTITVG